MSISARRYGELRRDALGDLGEGMKLWIAHAHMTSLDALGYGWYFCDRCGAPGTPMPWRFGAFEGEVCPTFVCALCDLRYFDGWARILERRVAELLPPRDLVEV